MKKIPNGGLDWEGIETRNDLVSFIASELIFCRTEKLIELKRVEEGFMNS